MKISKTMLSFAVAAILLTGCKAKQDEAAAVAAPSEETADIAVTATPDESADNASSETADVLDGTADADAAAAPVAVAFNINTVPVSDKQLPEWPYIVLPEGYALDSADDIAKRSKDLARVPVWTGSQLLWLEGRTFSDEIETAEGKSFSKFELRKNLQQSVEALGGVRLSERTFDKETYKADEKAVDDFRREFSKVRDAYWYDHDADTYLIRRADKTIWVVAYITNSYGGIMVAEGPLPEPSKK